MKTSRRKFISRSILATAGIGAGFNSVVKSAPKDTNLPFRAGALQTKRKDAFSVSIFSKQLQWLGYDDMAKVAAEIGFDGVDLTVRPGGHVEPEKVEEDLPKAMEAVKKAGLNMYMITTSVVDPDDPVSEKILKTASSLGIKHYRMGWFHYDDTKTVEENMGVIHPKLTKMAAFNEKYSISGEYQNHSGNYGDGVYFGAPIWDLATALKGINSRWLGSQYDVYHATIEGANAWPVGFRLISPYIRSIDIKDFKWSNINGKWTSETVPLGEGMVDYKMYFGLLKQYNFNGPICIHYEYPLGGAEHGAREITMKKEEIIPAMRKDLLTLKKYLQEAKLV